MTSKDGDPLLLVVERAVYGQNSEVDISRSCTRLLMLTYILSMLQAFSSSTSSMMPSTVTSSGISALFSWLGSLAKTSAIIIWLPGRAESRIPVS